MKYLALLLLLPACVSIREVSPDGRETTAVALMGRLERKADGSMTLDAEKAIPMMQKVMTTASIAGAASAVGVPLVKEIGRVIK